jgi:cobaltochelatase CobS
MAKTDDILGELNSKFFELAGQVIDQKLNEKINNLLIGKDNLSPELKQMLMERQTSGGSGSVPPPPTSSSMPTPTTSGGKAIEWNETTKSIVADIMAGNNVYLYGVAGTGKTILAENIATYLGEGSGAGKRTINCSQWTSPTEIRGGQTITGYKQGTMIDAWEKGDILILDELPKLDPNTAGLLNDVLSKTADLPKTDDFGNVLWTEGWTYTTDGKGSKIYKGGFNPEFAISLKDEAILKEYVNECYAKAKRFGVIGTGNTDMKNMSPKFGGNNKQDYSLVDRFSGAYYKITFTYTESFEATVTFEVVRQFMYPIRRFLATQDVTESVSARTVLNVNRIYLQEMLINIQSPLALKINGMIPQEPLKTFQNSINNFLNALPDQTKSDFLQNNPNYSTSLTKATSVDNQVDFIIEFQKMYKINPFTGEPLTEAELKDLTT